MAETLERGKEALRGALAGLGRILSAAPALTPWGRRKQAAEAWFEQQAQNPREVIADRMKVLETIQDPMGRRLAERSIEQHQAQLEALRREADLRATETPDQTEARHEAEQKAAQAERAKQAEERAEAEAQARERARAEKAEVLRRNEARKAEETRRMADIREKAAREARETVELMRGPIASRLRREWAELLEEGYSYDAALQEARQGFRRDLNDRLQSRVWHEAVTVEFEALSKAIFRPAEELFSATKTYREQEARVIASLPQKARDLATQAVKEGYSIPAGIADFNEQTNLPSYVSRNLIAHLSETFEGSPSRMKLPHHSEAVQAAFRSAVASALAPYEAPKPEAKPKPAPAPLAQPAKVQQSENPAPPRRGPTLGF